MPLRSVSVRLTGRIEEEQKLGPPGFGQTPEKDVKLTVVVLRLLAPLDTCAASFEDANQPALHGLSVIQLNGVDSERAKSQVGALVDTYGWLDPGYGSDDFTPIVLMVDSIPALQVQHGQLKPAASG